ncbi:MAG: hypothetical protein NT154_14250 [Verrucomicrobia bacterium]|nr:hypothetical protein [Verrucomicrobiota bacterium]
MKSSKHQSTSAERFFIDLPLAPLLAVLAFSGFSGSSTERGGVLANPGFEAADGRQGWELNVYGAQPQIALDRELHHEGSQSLRVQAQTPSDTALGQEIVLRPNAWYRFSGWIKTRGLEAQSASVLGTLQVQNPAGRGIIASGPSHEGDNDWTEVPLYFKTPPDGRVRLCLFFAGFGEGTGTAWFDDLQLAEVTLNQQPIRVTAEPLGPGEISRYQYGQFIEYLCNLVPAMWSEKLFDGSFEGLSPYKFEFIKETDFKEKPWYPSGQVNRADYTLDRSNKVSGEVSRKIDVPNGASCTVGLSQDGIFVERSQICTFRCWLRAQNVIGPVRVRLHQGKELLAALEFRPGADWAPFTRQFKPKTRALDATLTIDFHGPGTLWLDNASLMPVNTVGGWRPDVVEAVRALKPGVIRFGGSALDEASLGQFEWKDTLGDSDHRRPFRAWGGLQPTGPGLEEIVQFCEAVGAEPLICVRFSGRKPSDAAQELEYFNGPTDSPIGAWRARNGHPEPYRIKFWQIGNERGGQEYEQQLPAFCQAMKAVDPNIKLFSSYPSPALLKDAGQWLDYVSPHHYSHDLVWMEENLRAVGRMIRQNAPDRAIKIGVTEWNTTAGDAGPRRAMLWTLANALACSRYHNLLHRYCHLVEIANRSNLINSFCSGIIQTDTHRLYKTPTYYAQQLYATLAGSRPLKLVSALPSNAGLDLSATLSHDGQTLTIFAVNDTGDEIARTLDLTGLRLASQKASVWTLADRERAGEPDVSNSFDQPERVIPVRSKAHIRSATLDYAFPALSLTVLRFDLHDTP